jgi:hypothetical protein
LTPEVLADVGARLDGVFLVLPVDDLAHALDEQPLVVLLEQRVPLAAPEHLDHVPAGAAEDRFQFLDDLAVAADRAVEALQVAVDDEDQVVELFTRRERDGAKRLRLVSLAVADERPHLLVRALLQPAILEVAHEARLVDRADWPEPHRHRREFPEVRHQPGVRVRRQAAAFLQLAAEVLQLLRRQPPLDERPRVDAGRGVALEVNDVAVVAVALALEEVVEADLVERRRRREGRDVAADAVFELVGLHHHCERVPAHQALDAALDLAAPGKRRLLRRGDGVDVRGIGRKGLPDTVAPGVIAELAEQPADTRRTAGLEHVIERLEPLARFEGFELRCVFRCSIAHDSSTAYSRGRGTRRGGAAPVGPASRVSVEPPSDQSSLMVG